MSDPALNPTTPQPTFPYASNFQPLPNPPQTRRSGPLTPGVAFVTGGASGLGNAIARSFARDGARAVVIVDLGRDVEVDDGKGGKKVVSSLEVGRKRIESVEGGCECLAIRADVTKEEDIERAVQEAVAKFGRIDYAANFAGVLGPMSPITTTTLSSFQSCLAVNTTGVLLSTKHELRQMSTQPSIQTEPGRPHQSGAIVNCASINSMFSMPGTVAYTASKHAVVGITKAAALEGRSVNVRVNAVSPGFLETPMIQGLLNPGTGNSSTTAGAGAGDAAGADAASTGSGSGSGTASGGLPRIGWETFEARQGRKAAFEEVGDVVVTLCGTRMSLVNGVNLFIDGGFSINEGNN